MVAQTIVAGAPNTGSYSWTPSSSLAADESAEGYGIQLIDDSLCKFQWSAHFGLHPAKQQQQSPVSSAPHGGPSSGGKGGSQSAGSHGGQSQGGQQSSAGGHGGSSKGGAPPQDHPATPTASSTTSTADDKGGNGGHLPTAKPAGGEEEESAHGDNKTSEPSAPKVTGGSWGGKGGEEEESAHGDNKNSEPSAPKVTGGSWGDKGGEDENDHGSHGGWGDKGSEPSGPQETGSWGGKGGSWGDEGDNQDHHGGEASPTGGSSWGDHGDNGDHGSWGDNKASATVAYSTLYVMVSPAPASGNGKENEWHQGGSPSGSVAAPAAQSGAPKTGYTQGGEPHQEEGQTGHGNMGGKVVSPGAATNGTKPQQVASPVGASIPASGKVAGAVSGSPPASNGSYHAVLSQTNGAAAWGVSGGSIALAALAFLFL
jgi:hypothetical protein